jgi:hypothetical protein
VIHALLLAAATSATPQPTSVPLYRVVPLACTGDRLAIGGGAVLRLADGVACATIVAGRAISVALDADGRATPHPYDRAAQPPGAIPRTAFVFAPTVENDADDATMVTVTIDVTVPARTPPTDDIYVSTDRSGWSPTEIRMDRVDARHYRLALRLHRDARVAFRITRGSYATIERDAARALPPAHIAEGKPDAQVHVDVAAWADID